MADFVELLSTVGYHSIRELKSNLQPSNKNSVVAEKIDIIKKKKNKKKTKQKRFNQSCFLVSCTSFSNFIDQNVLQASTADRRRG